MNVFPRSPRLLINPAHAELLQRLGLQEARDFLGLREEIVSGHPDRQVSRVDLGGMMCYLKREYRVPWRERIRNLWAGFGMASKSLREAQFLRSLSTHFDGCPEWIAAGELPDGQAFLLVRGIAGATTLPHLIERLRNSAEGRRRVAAALGEALGRLHAANAVHGDLYANHALIDPQTLRVNLLDWQRAHLRNGQSWRDFATLAVTLQSGAVTLGDLLSLLRAYRIVRGGIPLSETLNLDAVRQEVKRLSGRRHIRAKARLAPYVPSQSLICLDGNALRVTPGFRELWPDTLPDFLEGTDNEDCEIVLPDGRMGRWTRRCHQLSWFQRRGEARRRWTSPERLQMNLLNRLERAGIEALRVLAVGERPVDQHRVCAFLLTGLPAGAMPLEEWLFQNPGGECIRREAGDLLARLHEAGCFYRNGISGLGMTAKGLALLDVSGLRIRRRFRGFWSACDVRRLERILKTPSGG